MILCSLISLPVDDPETSYNESETPISSAAIVEYIAAYSNPLVEVRDTVTVVPAKREAWDNSITSADTVRQSTCNSNSRLKLLCTLIC